MTKSSFSFKYNINACVASTDQSTFSASSKHRKTSVTEIEVKRLFYLLEQLG